MEDQTAIGSPAAGCTPTRTAERMTTLQPSVTVDFGEVLKTGGVSAIVTKGPAMKLYAMCAPHAFVVLGATGPPAAGPAVARLVPPPPPP